MVQMNMLHMSEQLHHSTKLAQGQETLQRLEDLPLMLRTVVQDEIKAVLLVHQSQPSAKSTMSTNSSFADSQTHYNGLDGLTDLGQSPIVSWTSSTHCGLSGKRQDRQFSRRDTWFGHIEISWTTTTQDYHSDQFTEYLTASSREIKVYVNTWLTKSVISFMPGNNQPKLPDLSLNYRLRLSRMHMGPRIADPIFWKPVGDNSMESEISRAIGCADVETVHRLLKTHEAHPNDCIVVHISKTEHDIGSYYCYLSIFEYVSATMKHYAIISSRYGGADIAGVEFLLRLCTIAQQLIVFGAECSRFWPCCLFVLSWRPGLDGTLPLSLVERIINLIR